MKKLTTYKIDFQRWMYKRRRDRDAKKDIDMRLKAIKKAEKLSAKSKKRLWVLKMDVCDYRIFTKPEIKTAMRKLNQLISINYYQTNEYIIHITNKPIE